MIRNALIALYILVILTISAVSRAHIPVTTNEGFDVQKYVGQLVPMADGTYGFVTLDSKPYAVESALDLSQFAGKKVMVDGLELIHQVGLVLEPQTEDPLPSLSADKSDEMVMLVFGIREVE